MMIVDLTLTSVLFDCPPLTTKCLKIQKQSVSCQCVTVDLLQMLMLVTNQLRLVAWH